EPAEGAPPAEAIEIVGNRFQNDHGSGLRILHSRGARVLHNTFANYRPDEESGSTGAALVVGAESTDSVLESNSFLEASIGLRVGESDAAGAPPREVAAQRNFFQNTLTPESLALDVRAGKDVHF